MAGPGVLVWGAFAGLALSGGASAATGGGDNVLLLTPIEVTLPQNLPGDCKVRAVVRQVWDGTGFRTGQTLSIDVPCSDRAPAFQNQPARPARTPLTMGLDPVVLRHSTLGFAHVDDAGRLIWSATPKAYGPWGVAFGYRVLDGVKLPLDQAV